VGAGWLGAPVDEVVERGGWHAAQPADVDGADLAGVEQFVEQAASDAEPLSGLVDAQQQPLVGAQGDLDAGRLRLRLRLRLRRGRGRDRRVGESAVTISTRRGRVGSVGNV
jgi:hypothetical protein